MYGRAVNSRVAAIAALFALFIALAIPSRPALCAAPPMPDKATLVEAVMHRVIDGDTAEFDASNVIITVRLIGVNAPEEGRRYSNNAASYLTDKLSGQTVYLEKDEEWLDDYGRSLYYAWLEDGTLLNAEILREGAAVISFFPPNVKYVQALTEAQQEALESKSGMWSVYGEHKAAAPGDEEPRYIGNINSLVLHKMTCTGLPKEKNRVYFDSHTAAIDSGYRDCGICMK